MSVESEGWHIYKGSSRTVHDKICDCDCWPCFYLWDEKEGQVETEQTKLFIACYSCMGEGCIDCRERWLEDQ